MRWIALILSWMVVLGWGTPAGAIVGGYGFPSCFNPPAGGQPALASPCYPPPVFLRPLEPTYVTVDMVGFRRDWQTSQTFATLDTPTNSVLGTNDIVFAFQPGLRLLIGRQFDERRAIEASYIGLLQWNEVRSVANSTLNVLGTAGNLFSPFTNFGDPAQVGFDYNDFASIRTVTAFNNAELNLRQNMYVPNSCMQGSVFVGLRYINVRDKFYYRTQSLEPATAGTANSVDVLAKNSMIGMQAGGALDVQFEPRAWLNFEGKLMMLGNSSSQQTAFTTGPLAGAPTTVNGDRSQSRVTLGADLAATVLWKFTPNCIARAGYQAIFLDGLALGSNNFLRNVPIMTTNPNQLSQNGHLAFHGPFGGVTITW